MCTILHMLGVLPASPKTGNILLEAELDIDKQAATLQSTAGNPWQPTGKKRRKQTAGSSPQKKVPSLTSQLHRSHHPQKPQGYAPCHPPPNPPPRPPLLSPPFRSPAQPPTTSPATISASNGAAALPGAAAAQAAGGASAGGGDERNERGRGRFGLRGIGPPE